MFLNFSGDEARFRLGVQRLVITDQSAANVLGPERLLFALDVVLNDSTCNVQNVLRRAIIFFQPNHFRGRKVFLELQNILNVRAAPAINRLVRIADDADVLLLFSQQANQSVLKGIRVLVFVDQDVAEAIVVSVPNFRNIAQQAYRLNQQIVKIQGVILEQAFFVQHENARNRRAPLVDVLGFRAKGFGVLASILRRADRRLHRARSQLLFIKTEIANAILREPNCVVLIVNRERAGVAGFHRLDVAAQDADAQTVKGRNQRRTANFQFSYESGDASAHLFGGLVGEGDGQNVARPDIALGNQISDAMRDDPGLA